MRVEGVDGPGHAWLLAEELGVERHGADDHRAVDQLRRDVDAAVVSAVSSRDHTCAPAFASRANTPVVVTL